MVQATLLMRSTLLNFLTLEKASDYEKGIRGLSEADKGIVEKLQSLGGSIGEVAGKKHKCMFILS